MVVGWRPAKAGGGGAERAHLARAAKRGVDGGPAAGESWGADGWRAGGAGQELSESTELLLDFTELGEVHRNVGIPGSYAGSGVHRNAGPGSGPDDFCVLGGSFVAARWTGRALRTGALRQSQPAGPGWVF